LGRFWLEEYRNTHTNPGAQKHRRRVKQIYSILSPLNFDFKLIFFLLSAAAEEEEEGCTIARFF
jgi:hypothetical protein